MKKLVYPFVLWFLFARVAQAQDEAKLAQRLVERSGVAMQLQAVPKSFTDQMPRLRGQVPDDLLLALTDAGREAYRPEVRAKEIAQNLAQTLKPEEMRKALAWLETGVGRRVTLAEERASASMDDASLKRYAEQTKDQPKEQLKEVLRQAMPGIFGYTYREVSDTDLEAYIRFLRSADGKRVNDAITDAFGRAMIAASVRVGQLVDQRSSKQPT